MAPEHWKHHEDGFGDPKAASIAALGQSGSFCVLCKALGLEQYSWHLLGV